MRLFSFQHAEHTIQYASSKSSFKYLFTVIPSMPFVIHFTPTIVHELPYVAIYGESIASTLSSLINFKIPTSLLTCNNNELQILTVSDSFNSCVEVSMQYSGKGELYLLARLSTVNVPGPHNIIQEGIFLGVYVLLRIIIVANMHLWWIRHIAVYPIRMNTPFISLPKKTAVPIRS